MGGVKGGPHEYILQGTEGRRREGKGMEPGGPRGWGNRTDWEGDGGVRRTGTMLERWSGTGEEDRNGN